MVLDFYPGANKSTWPQDEPQSGKICVLLYALHHRRHELSAIHR